MCLAFFQVRPYRLAVIVFRTRLAREPSLVSGLSSFITAIPPSARRMSHRLKRLFIISHGLCHGESDLTLATISLSGKCGRNEIDLVELLSALNDMMPVEQLG